MSWRLIAAALVVMIVACGVAWRSGWSSHADHINALADQKRKKAEKAIKPIEDKAAQAKDAGKVIYQTITRDVVKYVQSPDRTRCNFDDDSIQLRQRAIDAANAIPGFDATPVQSK
ncbi:hypothetical protein [Serratia fonticola]